MSGVQAVWRQGYVPSLADATSARADDALRVLQRHRLAARPPLVSLTSHARPMRHSPGSGRNCDGYSWPVSAPTASRSALTNAASQRAEMAHVTAYSALASAQIHIPLRGIIGVSDSGERARSYRHQSQAVHEIEDEESLL